MLSPWYITGFCDGEAAFTFSRTGNKGLNLYFSIKVRNDDKPLVARIQDFFGVGKIYPVKPRLPGPRSGFTKASAYYRVHRVSELAKIVQHFDRYPLFSKKATAYQLWKEMFLIKSNFRKPDFAKLEELALKLSDLNSKKYLPDKKEEEKVEWRRL